MIEHGGIVGESARAEWQPHVMADEQRQAHERFMAEMPKGMRKHMMTMPEPAVPWTSLGQAPTDEQVERNGHQGCA